MSPDSSVKIKRNFLRNRTSVHVVSDTLTLRTVSAFYQVAVSDAFGGGDHTGSMDGEMVLSINTERKAPPPAAAPKKRKERETRRTRQRQFKR